jgi:hypothetical protein
MAVQAAERSSPTRITLIHPLHHPSDHLEPMVYVQGPRRRRSPISRGGEYIDGLAGL